MNNINSAILLAQQPVQISEESVGRCGGEEAIHMAAKQRVNSAAFS